MILLFVLAPETHFFYSNIQQNVVMAQSCCFLLSMVFLSKSISSRNQCLVCMQAHQHAIHNQLRPKYLYLSIWHTLPGTLHINSCTQQSVGSIVIP